MTRPSGSAMLEAAVPTTHPWDGFSVPLIRKRLVELGWRVEQREPITGIGTRIDQLPIEKSGKQGKVTVFRTHSSEAIALALQQSGDDGARVRRGAALLTVWMGGDLPLATQLRDALAVTEAPTMRKAPTPIAGSPWQRIDVPAGVDLNAIWGKADDELFVVGAHGDPALHRRRMAPRGFNRP